MANTPISCERCGMEFYTSACVPRVTTCSECPIIIRRDLSKGAHRIRGHRSYDMTIELVTLRVAFEMLEPLLKMRRHRDAERVWNDTEKALEILGEVEAPARETSFINLT